ncbi:hypothetical protein E4K66_08300 [Bradyrhizobium frederickii]|uniref:Uncharacterized protein n=1 Tax=Bradyrhizobium frederickii TaxID=2560054 RepID=A0A4Y9LB67_9BRAD|nr:hypothetical protein E4K66_08300 [Bradyrhizobium frederickii]
MGKGAKRRAHLLSMTGKDVGTLPPSLFELGGQVALPTLRFLQFEAFQLPHRHGRACPGHPRLSTRHEERGCPGQARA